MRILFVSATRIGDAVLSTGLLGHLVESHPGARITVACGPAAAELFETVPGLERVIVMEKMVASLHWLRLWASSVTRFWDLVVDLRSAPLTYLLAAKRQAHMHKHKHHGHRIRQLAGVLGLQDNPPLPRLWSDDIHDQKAVQLIPEGPPVLAIGPTANWRAKTWRAENFAELCERVTGADGLLPGGRIALFGAPEERPEAIGLIESIPAEQRIDLLGQVGLLDIHACLKRCAFYVGNDSGLMHIAAAAGVPTLGLFGPSREELYGPCGALSDSVRTPQSFDDIHPDGFDHRTSDSLMDGLGVERVYDALAALAERAKGAAA
ncbi:MAG: glycosyltransferase family 9 protein [Rhodospirillaceae bacterium]|jgi:heptosyltransferase III|nr:glycosyltransferase family 9 protein [Rhodospirillaceae bacterium]